MIRSFLLLISIVLIIASCSLQSDTGSSDKPGQSTDSPSINADTEALISNYESTFFDNRYSGLHALVYDAYLIPLSAYYSAYQIATENGDYRISDTLSVKYYKSDSEERYHFSFDGYKDSLYTGWTVWGNGSITFDYQGKQKADLRVNVQDSNGNIFYFDSASPWDFPFEDISINGVNYTCDWTN